MTAKNSKTLVIAARGTVGSALVRNLVERSHSVRAAARDTAGLAGPGVEGIALDVFDAEARKRAFQGIERAFLLSPAGYSDQYALLSPMVAQAVSQGVRQVVLMTAMGVEHDDTLPFRRLELELESSGLHFNILRPNWFMQNFASYWLNDLLTRNGLFLPAAAARVSFVDVRDIADVAAALLTEGRFANRSFALTGPNALTHEQAAEILSRAADRPFRYEDTAPSAFCENLIRGGLPNDYAQLLVKLFEIVRAGHYAQVTNDVETVLGRPARSLADYAREFAGTWKR